MKTITELRKMTVDELKDYLKEINLVKYDLFGRTTNKKGLLIQLITNGKYTG